MLTERQRQIFDFLVDSFQESGQVPSCAEIQQRFRFSSPATVTSHLNLMEKKGAIRRVPGRARNIVLPDMQRSRRSALHRIPLLGVIPAGFPSDQEQVPDRHIEIDTDTLALGRHARVFALRVSGDSMIEADIEPGDLVIMEDRPAQHQDIVAALIDHETTLKTFLLERGRPYLRAANKNYPDLIPAEELLIQGVLHTVISTRRRSR